MFMPLFQPSGCCCSVPIVSPKEVTDKLISAGFIVVACVVIKYRKCVLDAAQESKSYTSWIIIIIIIIIIDLYSRSVDPEG